jgi:hypothetical protein
VYEEFPDFEEDVDCNNFSYKEESEVDYTEEDVIEEEEGL